MSIIAIGPAVESGFRLIRREPLAVLAWGFVSVLFGVGSLALFGPVYLNAYADFAAMSGSPNLAPVAADAARIQGLGLLLTVVSLIMRSILACAVCRAVLKPQERRLGYLRLGMAEFFLMLIYIGVQLGILGATLIAALALGLTTGALMLAHALPAAFAIGGFGVVALLGLMLYVLLRLALITPLVVEDEKPHFASSWTLTRGHVGSLFAVGLCVIGFLVTVDFLITGLVLGFSANAFGGMVGGVQGAARVTAFLAQPPAAILSAIGPYLAVAAVIGVPLTGCGCAILFAPWARAYLDLTGRSPVRRAP